MEFVFLCLMFEGCFEFWNLVYMYLYSVLFWVTFVIWINDIFNLFHFFTSMCNMWTLKKRTINAQHCILLDNLCFSVFCIQIYVSFDKIGGFRLLTKYLYHRVPFLFKNLLKIEDIRPRKLSSMTDRQFSPLQQFHLSWVYIIQYAG